MLKDEEGIWLTTREVAERLGLSESRIRLLRLQGELGTPRIIGRDPFLLQSQVDRYKPKPSGYPAGRPRKREE